MSWTPSAPCDFGGTLPGGFAAHTKLDHRTGELHAIAYFWAWDHVQHVVVDPAGKVTRTTVIPVADGPMMHDFALTEKYVVLLDLPVTFSLNAVTQGKELPYVWNDKHQARVGLLPRDGSSPVRWIEIEPCWVFHCLNAYDEGAKVVVDLCQYNDSFDVSTLWAAHGPVTLDRWIIDPAAAKVTQQRLDDRGQEFPRVDDRIVSRPHRYGYSAQIGEVTRAITATGDFGDDAFSNAILKHDLAAHTVQAHEFGRDATAGEAVFAPAAAGSGEDDGYVMAFVHNPDRGAADLVILAAQDFTAEPVARVHLPARIPLGFHGSWIPDR
jgi:carotenoid cleavage dioxygenase-like enzyme